MDKNPPTSGYNLQITNKDDLIAIATLIFESGLCPDSKNVEQVAYKVMYGGELGIPPIASAQGIFIQYNKKKTFDHEKKQDVWNEIPKPSMTSALMACLIKKSGRYNYKLRETTDTKSAIEVFENGESLGVRTFTIDDAKKAELTIGPNASNYKKYPRNMLHARNISNIAKMDCTDVFGGMPVYTPEELNMVVDGETGEPVQETQDEGKLSAGSSTGAKSAKNAAPTSKEPAVTPAKADEKPAGKAPPAPSATKEKESTASKENAPSASGKPAVSDEEFASLKSGIWKAYQASGFSIEVTDDITKAKNTNTFKKILKEKFDLDPDNASFRQKLNSSSAGEVSFLFGSNPKR